MKWIYYILCISWSISTNHLWRVKQLQWRMFSVQFITDQSFFTLSGCYSEILGRWLFKRIGNSKHPSLLIQHAKHVSYTTGVYRALWVPGWILGQCSGGVQGWSAWNSSYLKVIKSLKIANSKLFCTGQVPQNKRVASSKDMKNCWAVEKFSFQDD